MRNLLLFISILLFVKCVQPQEPRKHFRFTDSTAQSGLEKPLHGAFNHAVAWGDFNGDGKLDLFLGNFADRGSAKQFGLEKPHPNQLFRQVAGGNFELVANTPVAAAMRCSGAVFVDLDNDGDLDLYVTSNRQEKPEGEEWQKVVRAEGCRLYRNDTGSFVDISAVSGLCPADLVRCRDIGVFDHDGDGLLDLLVMQDQGTKAGDQAPGLRFFRNLGNLRFEDATRKSGLPADAWGAGIAVADLNGDGRADFYVCGCNRLFFSNPNGVYAESPALKKLFAHPEKDLDWVTGAAFGDINGDGLFDLITGRHHYHGPSRVHVYLNEGLKDGMIRFREVTADVLGVTALPQKAPHPEIQDFDNDGIPDLYWSTFFAEGKERWPFLCKGLGVKDGLPRFDVPRVPPFDFERMKSNLPPKSGVGMVYYVDGPAVDYDGDGRLDFLAGNWPPEATRLYRNVSDAGNWLQVKVDGKRMNRMGVGAQVRVLSRKTAAEPSRLLGVQEITLNGGYSSSRPAMVHFGLGKIEAIDIEVSFQHRQKPHRIENVRENQLLRVAEPE